MLDSLKEKLTINLATLILKIYSKTLRLSFIGLENLDFEKPSVFIFWHNRQIFMPLALKVCKKKLNSKKLFCMLISQHRDGRIAASIVKKLGVDSISGSSTRGGGKALLALSNVIKHGSHVGITPDGPRGPIYKLKPGAVKLASMTGTPIYPVCISASSFWSFEKSWDKMQLPKPFSKIICKIGAKIENYDVSHVEQKLIELTESSDNHFNN